MPPEAKVAIIEDQRFWQDILRENLPDAGHTFVGSASTMEDARGLMSRFGDLGVQVVLLNGNLSPNRSDGAEGRMLAREIGEIYPDIKIIGVTQDEDGVVGAHVNVWKGEYDPDVLNDLIDEI